MFLSLPSAHGHIRVPSLISDKMVLQADTDLTIWGTAEPGEKVVVSLNHVRSEATADTTGQWKAKIGALQSGGPFEMTIAGQNTIVIHDVVVGQVWTCSGQSNMEFHLSPGPDADENGAVNYPEEIASANYPMIRLFSVPRTVASRPQANVEGKWEMTSPLTVGHFSAVCYFFGRDLFNSLHQPIGLILSAWGGTPAESWTTTQTVEAYPDFKSIVDSWRHFVKQGEAVLGNFEADFRRWEREANEAEMQGKPVPSPPKIPDDPRRSNMRPGGLFNGMIAPLVNYRIKGVIWYQGEKNLNRGMQYRKLFPAMIDDWRRAWGYQFPFLYVQLSSLAALPSVVFFPLVREAQLMTLSVPDTAMAVTVDIGDPRSYHPRNKQEVGRRLALAAKTMAYQERLTYSGPIYKGMKVEGNGIRVYFTHCEDGLASRADSQHLRGFEISGLDEKFYAADAAIDGNTVFVRSDKVPSPIAVRYAWQNYPVADLFNESGLPASPFRTDSWSEATEVLAEQCMVH